MKSFLVAMTMAASWAWAGNYHVSHDYSQVLGEISLNNACVTDSTVRSIEPVRTCATELQPRFVKAQGGDSYSGYTEWYCPRYHNTHLEYSRNFEKNHCMKYRMSNQGDQAVPECVSYGKMASFMPKVIKIKVWKDQGDRSGWPGMSKNFKFPNCE